MALLEVVVARFLAALRGDTDSDSSGGSSFRSYRCTTMIKKTAAVPDLVGAASFWPSDSTIFSDPDPAQHPQRKFPDLKAMLQSLSYFGRLRAFEIPPAMTTVSVQKVYSALKKSKNSEISASVSILKSQLHNTA